MFADTCIGLHTNTKTGAHKTLQNFFFRIFHNSHTVKTLFGGETNIFINYSFKFKTEKNIHIAGPSICLCRIFIYLFKSDLYLTVC